MTLLKISLVLATFIAFTVACAQPAANNSGANSNASRAANQTNQAVNMATPAASPVKSEAAKAEELYTVNCMTCHKDSGKGGKATVDGKTLDVEDLTTDKKKQRSDEKLAQDISDGAESDGMPAFKDKLTPEQIKMVVGHLRTLQAK